MAQDGVIFRFLGSINQWTNTPLLATWVGGVMMVSAALLFDLTALVQMKSIGTLMAYTMAAVSVLSLHHQRDQVCILAVSTASTLCLRKKRPNFETV